MTLRNPGATASSRTDLETRASADDHQDLRLWLRVMTVHKLIAGELRRRLRASFDMSFARFDLMAQLERSPSGIRMGELSSRLMVTTGNITSLTDELEADGLVERMVDPRNRRAFLVRLTQKGRKAFQTAAKAHEAWVAELLGGLSSREKKLLFNLLAKQKAFLAGQIPGPAPKQLS